MHYYQFNIKDYRKDTAHLTPIEHYIYRQLIDWYYLDEKQIPKKTQVVLRRLQLESEHEEKLSNVLEDFFVETDSGWSHRRIDSEIEVYQKRSAKNALNGQKGGRPKKQQLTSEEKPKKTQSVIYGNPDESQKKPNQEPLTKNHKPTDNKKNKQKKSKPDSWKKFFQAYPENKKGGTDASAWKAAQREGLESEDFEAMLRDVLERKRQSPGWYSTFALGITRYISEKFWLTPIVPDAQGPPSALNHTDGGRRQTRDMNLREQLTDRSWAMGGQS